MATEAQRTQFRRRIGDNDGASEVFSDAEIDDIYSEAGLSYTNEVLIGYQAMVIGVQWLMADAAKLTTYKQNNSTENQSDIFKHLKQLMEMWQDTLERTARRVTSGVSMARMGPHRVKAKRLPRDA